MYRKAELIFIKKKLRNRNKFYYGKIRVACAIFSDGRGVTEKKGESKITRA